MRLAWNNILFDRTRFAVTVLGIAAAVFLIVFQSSILNGFLGASSRIIESADADLWVAARGVECFEFPAPIEKRYVEIAQGVPGVAGATPVCTRSAQFRKRDGSSQVVALVGADAEAGARFPTPHQAAGGTVTPNALLVDASNVGSLNIAGQLPLDVEVNQRRAQVIGAISGFSSFLGSPYVFASYRDGADFLGLRPEETTFILVRLNASVDPGPVRDLLRSRLPNVDIWTRDEFAQKARIYWISQTGAGGAIAMAALLGFLVGLAIVSQAIYATTMEHLEEFATLKAIGAGNWFVLKVVLCQALACGVVGYLLGVGVATPLVKIAAENAIPWVNSPWWIRAGAAVPTLLMCFLASIVSIRAALKVEPAKVFRA